MSDKVKLKIAHSRTIEIDKAEIDQLLVACREQGFPLPQKSLINVFFKTTLFAIMEASRGTLDDLFVKGLWNQFKKTVSQLKKFEKTYQEDLDTLLTKIFLDDVLRKRKTE
jgi:hypothetical protein